MNQVTQFSNAQLEMKLALKNRLGKLMFIKSLLIYLQVQDNLTSMLLRCFIPIFFP
jgi:hypothetical protein